VGETIEAWYCPAEPPHAEEVVAVVTEAINLLRSTAEYIIIVPVK